MFFTPARCAARTFSFTPPIGSTLPRSVISPVIATSLRVGTRASADTSAVASVMPADGLACVPLDDRLDRFVGDADVFLAEAGAVDRLRREEPPGDLDLLDLGVAGELQHFHPVAQRLGNRVQDVRRADEHHARE